MAVGRESRVLITGGGTIAPIDEVRVIANLSSGALAAGLARAFLERGAHVWHLRTPTAERTFDRGTRFDLLAEDAGVEYGRIEATRRLWLDVRDRLHPVDLAEGTVEEYAEAVREALTRDRIDVAILAAAVSDFAPIPIVGKIDSRGELPKIALRRTPKVIGMVREWSPSVFLVGFKLLTGASESELIEAGARACQETDADLAVANDQRAKVAGRAKQDMAGSHPLYLVDRQGGAECLAPGPGQLASLAGAIETRYRQREVVPKA